MSLAALVRLFKIGQLFQSAKGYPMRNRKTKAVLYEPNERQIAHRVRNCCQPRAIRFVWP
jgi:hypothetical protein